MGAAIHRAHWVPAEHLAELDANLIGPIQVIARYRPPESEAPEASDTAEV